MSALGRSAAHACCLAAFAFSLANAAEKEIVYNATSGGARSPLEIQVHEDFGKQYKIEDVIVKERMWVFPHGINPSPTPPVYRDGVCVPGEALVAFIIWPTGSVSDARLMRSTNGFLGSLAVELAKKKEFRPGQLDGQPVASLAVTNFRFPCPAKD